MDKKDEKYTLDLRKILTSMAFLANVNEDDPYVTKFLIHMRKFEEERYLAYDDADPRNNYTGGPVIGFITIGLGFNMDAEGAKDYWRDALKGKVSFDDARVGLIKLSLQQVRDLFNEVRRGKKKELMRIYGKYWKAMLYNEQFAIEDMYYNGPNLVRSNTKFYRHMIDYLDTGLFSHLEKAVYEVRVRSNPPPKDKPDQPVSERKGIQRRRDMQAMLLSSFELPEYQGKEKRYVHFEI